MAVQSTTQVVAFPETSVPLLDAFLRGLPTATTRSIYRRIIQAFGQHLGDADLMGATRRDVEAFRSHLEAIGRAPQTIARTLSALTGFYSFALDEGIIERNPASRARRPKLPDVSPRRALSQTESRAILSVPDGTTLIGLRDRALVTTLSVQGLRISEALGLTVEDIAEEQGHKVAQVTGKGGKVVRIPLAAGTYTAITSWLTAATILSGPLFVAVLKGGRVQAGKRMSARAAWKRIVHLARRAGIERAVHPHLFRHAAITEALRSGCPLHEVQDYARHADPRTTRRYDSHRQSLSNRTAHVLAATLLPSTT